MTRKQRSERNGESKPGVLSSQEGKAAPETQGAWSITEARRGLDRLGPNGIDFSDVSGSVERVLRHELLDLAEGLIREVLLPEDRPDDERLEAWRQTLRAARATHQPEDAAYPDAVTLILSRKIEEARRRKHGAGWLARACVVLDGRFSMVPEDEFARALTDGKHVEAAAHLVRIARITKAKKSTLTSHARRVRREARRT